MIRYVTVSEIEDFLKCRWRWYARWRLNRVPRRFPKALIVGTAVHDILEGHFTGTPLGGAFDSAVEALEHKARKVADPDHRVALLGAAKELAKYRPQIVGWRDLFTIEETLAVEEPIEFDLGSGWRFRGRPDRVVVVNGKVYHMQHKTAALSKPVDTFVQYLARSLHETLYGYGLRARYPDRTYGGSIFNIIRKGVAKTEGDAQRLNFQACVPIPDFDLDRARARLTLIAAEMRDAQREADEWGIWSLYDSPLEDAGPFGNSLDGYLPALRGKASLDDNTLFMPREETY